MKLSIALTALVATFAPSVMAQPGCVDVLEGSGRFEDGPGGWYFGYLPGIGGFIEGGGCARLNDRLTGGGIPSYVEDYFVKGTGTLSNVIAEDWDLAIVGHEESQACRAGYDFTFPVDIDGGHLIGSATLEFKLRSFTDIADIDKPLSSGDSGAAMVCIPDYTGADQLLYSTEDYVITEETVPGGDISHTIDVTGLLRESASRGHDGGTLFLDSRSLSYEAYHVTFWDDVKLTVCPPSGAGVDGDPHFKKWNGEWFDFHGICDMVLVSNPSFSDNLGLDIHIRSKGRNAYSFIETAAIRIGEDVLEIGSWGQYFLNGVEGAKLDNKKIGGKFSVEHECKDRKHCVFAVKLSATESIVVKTFKDMVSINVMGPTEANWGESVGMMGTFKGGKMLARDGATIIEDALLFGQEWQLTESEPKLFSAESTHVGACVPPTVSEGRRLGETVSEEDAEKACAHLSGDEYTMCVFDVIATADLEAADMHGAF